jgi:hypothetical protein
MRLAIGLSLLAIIALTGCSTPVEINRFDPVLGPPEIGAYGENNETFIKYNDSHYQITAALFEFNSVIVMPLSITNKTGEALEPSQYSVSLRDGRDLKEIKMLTRNNLVAVKNKVEGKGGGLNVGGSVVETTVNAIISITQSSNQEVVTKGLDHAINNYFSFRPIYANYSRKGILCFLVDFKLEYPLALMVDIKGEAFMLRFMPQAKKSHS